MALVVNTNVASIQAQYNVNKTNQSLQDSMAALSSGSRINSASDDAAGLSISSRMDSQIRGLSQAIRNANDGISLVDTAEGAMDEITNMLQRMRELALQSATDTNTLQDRENLDAEVQQLKAEIDRVANTTLFNNQALLDGSYASKTLQIGSESSQTLSLSIGNMSTTALGTSAVGSGVSGVTSNTATGTEATVTVSQLVLNGNDTYDFNLDIGNGAGGTVTVSVPATAMSSNDAQSLKTAIDTVVGASAMAGKFTTEVSGNVLTFLNLVGDSIGISSFNSAANGTANFSSISGAGASVTLNEDAGVQSLQNTNASPATNATGTLTLAANGTYSFRVNGTLIQATNLDGGGAGDTTTAQVLTAIQAAIGATDNSTSGSLGSFSLVDTSGQQIEITNFVSESTPAGSPGSIAMTTRVNANGTVSNSFANDGSDTSDIEDGDIVQMTFSVPDARYQFDIVDTASATITVDVDARAQSLQAAMEAARDAITLAAPAGVVARVVDGKLELENTDGSGTAFKVNNFVSTGKSAVTAGAASLDSSNLVTQGTASTTTGVEAVTSSMSLNFTESDTYSFTLTNAAGGGTTTISGAVAGSDFSAIVNAVNSNTVTTGVAARVDGTTVLLEKASGAGFTLGAMSSTGTGKILASNASGQGGSAVLEDRLAVTGGSTAAAGVADATEMELSIDSTDDVSFKISDGRANAVVRLTNWDTTDNTAILAEINLALSSSGSAVTATAASGTAPIVLTNATGGKIEITNFTSDATGIMTATPGQGQGVGKLLNDDGITGSQAAVSSIAVVDQAGANASIDAIDRAIEQINAERSKLGAVSNRLDYTVSNLGNIVSNTAASRSQIEDADFAAESANLAKNQILLQAGTAMLAQANASQQAVLSLLG